jgi:hypothetical protein
MRPALSTGTSLPIPPFPFQPFALKKPPAGPRGYKAGLAIDGPFLLWESFFGSSPNRVGDIGRFSICRHARRQGGRSREGPRGPIPPLTGHNEAFVLSSVRGGSLFCYRDRSWDSVFRKGVSGTGALRKPGNGSGIRVVPADSVPPGAGRTPRAENITFLFPPTRLGEEPLFLYAYKKVCLRARRFWDSVVKRGKVIFLTGQIESSGYSILFPFSSSASS